MSGWLIVVGLGPGAEAMVTPEVSAALAEATDVVGYIPYVARVPERPGLTRHASDNRVERDRALHALEMAEAGCRVVVVSSGDPGCSRWRRRSSSGWRKMPPAGTTSTSACCPASPRCWRRARGRARRWAMISARSTSPTISNPRR
ncbi:hypothetical protein GCM10020258_06150 [Sphingomonas yabuuchiae]